MSCTESTSITMQNADGRKGSRWVHCHPSKVTTSRMIFLLFLAGVAAALGYAANQLLTDSETRLAEEQFEAIADRALDTAVEMTLRKRMGTVTLASIASNAFPDVTMWPNVKMNGFEAIANNVIQTSNGRSMGLMPLVTEETLSEFTDFAYSQVIEGKCPNGTGVIPLGKGVYGLDSSLNSTDQRYLETDGSSWWGSPYKIMTPYLYHSLGCQILMFSLHSSPLFGKAIDDVIRCSNERARVMNGSASGAGEEPIECSTLTDVLVLTGSTTDVRSGPGAIVIQAIYPENDKTKLAGIISSTIVWEEVLVNVFSSHVSGVDCVLKTETQVYTYEVNNGVATLKGEGDLHDPKYFEYGRTILLNDPGVYSNYSASYTLSLYPNEELFEVYSTTNPVAATVGVVCVIVFTSILFMLYDSFVRQDIQQKQALLKAKRQFVRFISHEVRTPLNAVSMGLQFLQDEIARFIGSQFSKHNEQSGEPMKLEDKLTEWSDLSEDILHSTKSAVDVLNDLLNYDKIESGNLRLELTVVPIWSLIDHTASEFQLQAKKKSINYHIDFGELVDPGNTDSETGGDSKWTEEAKELQVIGDEVRITQVLRNLISNALKFTPVGGDLFIRTSWRTTESQTTVSSFTLNDGEEVNYPLIGVLQVAVTDTGAGMTKDQLAKVFGEGIQFNVNKLQAGQGSGLGLYIAKGLVEKHGGNLTAASEGLGLGTTFTMTLPLYRAEDRAHPKRLASKLSQSSDPAMEYRENGISSIPTFEPLRILIVDDSSVNRKLLMRLLQNKGNECDEAEDGDDAVEKVKEAMKAGSPYETILMDYEMPNKNGPDAAKEIRALGCDSFIVGVTGNFFPEDVSHFKACGANKVLPKPLKVRHLEDTWVEYGVGVGMDGPTRLKKKQLGVTTSQVGEGSTEFSDDPTTPQDPLSDHSQDPLKEPLGQLQPGPILHPIVSLEKSSIVKTPP